VIKIKAFLDSLDANQRPFAQVVFPNSQNQPAAISQGAGNKPVPRLVAGKFPVPERAIVDRHI
jgi:hypothetical protein